MPCTSKNMKQFANQLQTLFQERYTTGLSYLDKYRVRKEIKWVHSIKRKLNRAQCILRVSDKSGVFHVGQTVDYESKVYKYRQSTNAYVELSSDPLMETFHKIVRLLNDLHTKKRITRWQHTKMMPDREKVKLAYLYFVPKPHKVNFIITSSPAELSSLTMS